MALRTKTSGTKRAAKTSPPSDLRDRELAVLRAQLDALREAVEKRDERLEEEFYELHTAQKAALLSGEAASHFIAYRQTIRRIRQIACEELPSGARVAIVSKGDEELLKLKRLRGSHFPSDRRGGWAGFYPANGLSAIAHLETQRSRGIEYLLFPETAFWWLDKYPELKRHLERRYQLVRRVENVCAIYALCERGAWIDFEDAVNECRQRLNREPAILDWNTALDLANNFPERAVFDPPGRGHALPHLDYTIDIVAVNTHDKTVLAEAARAASQAVVNFAVKNGERASKVAWIGNSAAAALPSASIVIPAHNGAALTEGCLRALRDSLPPGFGGEIIIVDDASTDGTAAMLQRWLRHDDRLKIFRNEKNAGFLESAMRGANEATGEVLVFLNNDTVPLPGWLQPMLRVLRDFPDAGAVGGKLIFPDGSLQEAGGMIFRDGSAAHFGRDDHQTDSLFYNFVREADYCSGALLATPRELFLKLGGFDARYRPAYYEDTDYCFKIRSAGRRVYYQPESVVVHLEGASCGTDLSAGAKRYQEINHAKFLKKWKAALKRLPDRPAYTDVAAWRALAVRERGMEKCAS